MKDLAVSLEMTGRLNEAEKLERDALEIQRRVLGNDHPDTLTSMNNLAFTLRREGRYPEAEQLFREALDIRRRVLGNDHPATAGSMSNLAITLAREGRYPEAEQLFREALDMQTRILGDDHLQTVHSRQSLAGTLMREGRYGDAEIVLRKILDVQDHVSGKDLADVFDRLGTCLAHQGQFAEAEKWMREAIDKAVLVLGPESREAAGTEYNLACVEARTGRPSAALSHLNHAVEHGLDSGALSHMAADPDLKSLHGNPRFKQLVAQAQERAVKH
jgi:tetratricopeptide (TPR) repeat protein